MQSERISTPEHAVYFVVLDQRVRVDCADPELRAVLAANYAAMPAMGEDAPHDLHYFVECGQQPQGFVLSRTGESALSADDAGDLLFLLEKDIIVELQKRRPGLLFLHSAALDWRGKACLLVGESGAGKSTTAWALLHHEFGYLSDELGPIDVDTLQVHAYPHALCLKDLPAPPYSLGGDAFHLGRTVHVPTRSMPSAAILQPRELGALFFLKYSPGHRGSSLRELAAPEASAHLYVNVLNALAHPNRGLDAVVRIAEGVPSFALAAADLPSTCALIRSAMEQTQNDSGPAGAAAASPSQSSLRQSNR